MGSSSIFYLILFYHNRGDWQEICWYKWDGGSDAAAGRGCPWNEAFRCPEANLLPVTKFVGKGLLIKCLGQVDLPNAHLNIAPRTAPPHRRVGSPWFLAAHRGVR